MNDSCPDVEMLLLIAEAGTERWEAVLRHVIVCAHCRETMSDLVRIEQVLRMEAPADARWADGVAAEVLAACAAPAPAHQVWSRRLPTHVLAGGLALIVLLLPLPARVSGGTGAVTALLVLLAGAFLPLIDRWAARASPAPS